MDAQPATAAAAALLLASIAHGRRLQQQDGEQASTLAQTGEGDLNDDDEDDNTTTTVAIAIVCLILILALVAYGCFRMWRSGYGQARLKPRCVPAPATAPDSYAPLSGPLACAIARAQGKCISVLLFRSKLACEAPLCKGRGSQRCVQVAERAQPPLRLQRLPGERAQQIQPQWSAIATRAACGVRRVRHGRALRRKRAWLSPQRFSLADSACQRMPPAAVSRGWQQWGCGGVQHVIL